MMRRTMIAAVCLLAGCTPGGVKPSKPIIPVIDASSDEALDASIDRINLSLTDLGKVEFAEDCSTVTAPEAMKNVYRSGFNRTGGKEAVSARCKLFAKFHGQTARQIHIIALGYRDNEDRLKTALEADQVKAKALQEAAARDLEGVARKAVEAMRKSAFEQFGSKAAQAIIESQKVDALPGGKAWEVTGQFDGVDQDGVPLKARWRAVIELEGIAHVCKQVRLGERIAPAQLATANRPGMGAPSPGPASPRATKPRPKEKPKVVSKEAKEAKAKEALDRGKVLVESERRDEALRLYQAIVRDYPDTPAGAEAKEYADAMLGKPKKKK
jgi:hypothetical protein